MECLYVPAGGSYSVSSSGPQPNIIVTNIFVTTTRAPPRCPVCPFADDDDSAPLTPEQQAALVPVRWMPGVGLVYARTLQDSPEEIADHNALVNALVEEAPGDIPDPPSGSVDETAFTTWEWVPGKGFVRTEK